MNDPLQDFSESIERPQTYAEAKAEIQAEQAGLSRDQIAQKMTAKAEYVFDPETVEKPEHNWIERGLVMSCEGANHPAHRHFKVVARR